MRQLVEYTYDNFPLSLVKARGRFVAKQREAGYIVTEAKVENGLRTVVRVYERAEVAA